MSSENRWLIRWPVLLAVVLSVTFGSSGQAQLGQQLIDHHLEGDQASQSDVLLRWKFLTDDVIHVRMLFSVTTESEQRKRTAYIYDYKWKIASVDSAGNAVMRIEVDRIRFQHHSGEYHFEFDTSETSRTDLKAESPDVQFALNLCQALMSGEYWIKVTPRGVIETTAESGAGLPIGITPQSWPVLPEKIVTEGDSWSERPKYRFVRLEEVEDKLICRIESEIGASRFDVHAGRFIDHASKIGFVTESESRPGSTDRHIIETRQRLIPSHGVVEHTGTSLAQYASRSQAPLFLQESSELTSEITEFLVNERGLLQEIQSRLLAEIIDDLSTEALSTPTRDLPASEWMLVAGIYQRVGKVQGAIAALEKALDQATREESSYSQTANLLRIAERLARLGETDAAIHAANAIDVLDSYSVHFTDDGVVEVPGNAGRSYGLLLISAIQAKAGDSEDALITAEKILNGQTRAAARWVVALRQAECGDLRAALETARLASKTASGRERRHTGPEIVAEFTAKGPKTVRLESYQTLALSRIAARQLLVGDEQGAFKSWAQIGVPVLRDASLIELVDTLAKLERFDLVEQWIDRIDQPQFRSVARYYVARHLMHTGDFKSAEKAAGAIESSSWLAKLRLELCASLLRNGQRASLTRLLPLAQQAIESVEDEAARAEGLLNLARLQAKAWEDAAATRSLLAARDLIQKSIKDPTVRVGALAEIAAAMTEVNATEVAETTMNQAIEEAQALDKYEQSAAVLTAVQKQLKVQVNAVTEDHARSIPSATWRSQALSAVARRYADYLELEKSRRLFAEAFESALEITDVLGLDTAYSKGGAIRQISRSQAECDLPGLVAYLEHSKNPNIQAYGYLGAAESLVPVAANRAEARGFGHPGGILQELWHARLISQIVSPK